MKSYIHLLLLPSVTLPAASSTPSPLRRKLSTLLEQDEQQITYGPSKTQMLRQMIGIDVLVKDLSARDHDEHDFVRIEWVETMLEKAAKDVKEYNGSDKRSLEDSIIDLKNEIVQYKSEAIEHQSTVFFEMEEEKVKELVDSPNAALSFEEKYDFKSIFDKVGVMKLYITDLSNELMMLAVDVQKDAKEKKEQLEQAATQQYSDVALTPSIQSLLTDLSNEIMMAEKKDADMPLPTSPPHFQTQERTSHQEHPSQDMTLSLIQSLKEFGVSESDIAAHFGVDESKVQTMVAAAAAFEDGDGDMAFARAEDEKDWRFGLDEHEIGAKMKAEMLERGETLDP